MANITFTIFVNQFLWDVKLKTSFIVKTECVQISLTPESMFTLVDIEFYTKPE